MFLEAPLSKFSAERQYPILQSILTTILKNTKTLPQKVETHTKRCYTVS